MNISAATNSEVAFLRLNLYSRYCQLPQQIAMEPAFLNDVSTHFPSTRKKERRIFDFFANSPSFLLSTIPSNMHIYAYIFISTLLLLIIGHTCRKSSNHRFFRPTAVLFPSGILPLLHLRSSLQRQPCMSALPFSPIRFCHPAGTAPVSDWEHQTGTFQMCPV